jgi:hypothetical protein
MDAPVLRGVRAANEVAASVQECGAHERIDHLLTGGVIQTEETLRLRDRQPEPRHLGKFTTDARTKVGQVRHQAILSVTAKWGSSVCHARVDPPRPKMWGDDCDHRNPSR